MSSEPPKAPVEDLLAIMAALRTPGTGCPWDLAQTFQSIARYTIEEAYEVADAIERADMADLKDELGDLLLQVVYHARIAEEAQAFDFSDVVHAICAKMIRRHPHVFGSEAARAAGAPEGFWEAIKAQEKADTAVRAATSDAGGEKRRRSLLDDVPAAMPALTRAVKLQNEAAKVGFDWPSLTPVLEKLREELAELEQAAAAGEAGAMKEELGDLLFVLANVARHLKIDPEASLREANGKFVRRFRYIEERLAAAGRHPKTWTLSEMDRLWEEAKAVERGLPASGPGSAGAEPASP